MFRAKLCSSSGGQIALLQHLVSSLSVRIKELCIKLVIETSLQFYIYCVFILMLVTAIVTQIHLESRLKKEQSYTSTPPLCLHGMLYGQRFALPIIILSLTVVLAAVSAPCVLFVLFQHRD
jgi:hypothetical protein